jgi:FkbM family methyltransferase
MNFSAISDRSLPGKALRLALRAIPSGVQVPILQGPLRGKRWVVGSTNHGCWLGCFEYTKQRHFVAEVHSGAVVWDLGANVGYYSLLASVLAGPSGRIYSFEPVPRNVELLRRHLALNHIENCTIVPLAASNENGVAAFHVGSDPSMGRLADGATGAHGGNYITVRTARLDDLLISGVICPPHVIKCDIEGAEAMAIEGCARTLREYRPVIFLATHDPDSYNASCGLLRDLGYEWLPIGPSNDPDSELIARPKEGAMPLSPIAAGMYAD